MGTGEGHMGVVPCPTNTNCVCVCVNVLSLVKEKTKMKGTTRARRCLVEGNQRTSRQGR